MKAKNLGIFSALFASICCVGPLVLILLGLGSLGIGAVFGKYHWWFLGIGVLLIVIAWRYYFKEKKACNLKGCQIENRTRTLIILIIATLAIAFFIVLNLYTYIGKASTNYVSSKTNLETVVIPVKGMTCFTCEVTVSSALKKVKGVAEVNASAKGEKAKVTYDPSKANVKQLIQAINKTGYQAKMSD